MTTQRILGIGLVLALVFSTLTGTAGADHGELGTHWQPTQTERCGKRSYVALTWVHSANEASYGAVLDWNLHIFLDDENWKHFEMGEQHRTFIPRPDRGLIEIDVEFYGIFQQRQIKLINARVDAGADFAGHTLKLVDVDCIRNSPRNRDHIREYRVILGDPDVDE